MDELAMTNLEVSTIVGRSTSDERGNYVYFQLPDDVINVVEIKIKDSDFDVAYHKWQRIMGNIITYFEKLDLK